MVHNAIIGGIVNNNALFPRMGILLYRQMFSMWKRFGLLYKFTADYKQRAVALKALHGEADRVIKLRRSQLEAETESKEMPYEDDVNNNVVLGTKRRRAFLDSLLLTQRETMLLTDTNIREEVNTFMFAVSNNVKNIFSVIPFDSSRAKIPPGLQYRSHYTC